MKRKKPSLTNMLLWISVLFFVLQGVVHAAGDSSLSGNPVGGATSYDRLIRAAREFVKRSKGRAKGAAKESRLQRVRERMLKNTEKMADRLESLENKWKDVSAQGKKSH